MTRYRLPPELGSHQVHIAGTRGDGQVIAVLGSILGPGLNPTEIHIAREYLTEVQPPLPPRPASPETHRRTNMSDRYCTDLTMRTIYRDDQPIGALNTPEDAAHIIKVLNTVQKLVEANDHHVLDDAVMALVLEVERRDTQEQP